MLFNTLVEEVRALHRALGTDPRWAEEDADMLFSGEQSVFVWKKRKGGFVTVALIIRNGKLRSQVLREQQE